MVCVLVLKNIPGIVGLGEAINLVSKNNKDNGFLK